MQERPKREIVKASAVARPISEEMLVMKVLLCTAIAAMALSTGAAYAKEGESNFAYQVQQQRGAHLIAEAGGGNGGATVLLAEAGGGNGSKQPRYAEAGGGNGSKQPRYAEAGGGNGSKQPRYAEAGGGNGSKQPRYAEAGGGNGSKQPRYA
jgi:hypothetical protein